MSEFTTKAQGNLNTVLGAIGTAGALGVMNGGCGNGLLGGLFGNNYGCSSEDRPVTRYDSQKDATIAQQATENALLRANIFTDQKSIEVFNALNAKIESLKDVVNQTVCGQAVTNQKLSDNITFVDSKFDGVYREIHCVADKLRCYVDATFVPGNLVMPLDKICPPAQPATTTTTTTPTT